MSFNPTRSRPRPLSDDEIEELEDRLQSSYGDLTSFTELDGFFVALLCGPEYLLPTQYFDMILGSGDPNAADYMPTPEYHAETAKLMLRHWNDRSATLARGEFNTLPLPMDTLDLAGEWWSQGFLLILDYAPEDWEDYFRQLDEDGELQPMQEFAAEARRAPEERELTGERRKAMNQAVIDTVNRLYRRGAEARGQG